MNSIQEPRPVAVVGAGVAGLLAALRLARLGYRVELFERSRRPGGRARSVDQHGYRFNLGPHALYEKGRLNRDLTELNIPISGRATDAGSYRIVMGGRSYALPVGALDILRTPLLHFGERLQVLRALVGILQHPTRPTEGWANADTSARDWLARRARSLRARSYLETMVRLATYSGEPDLLSADAMITQVRIAMGGVLYLDDGWQSIVDALMIANASAGVRTAVGTRVHSVQSTPGGVRLQAEQSRDYAAVILACPPQEAHRLLGPSSPLAARLERIRPVRAACLDIGAPALMADTTFALDADRRLYFSVHSLYARLHAGTGAVVQAARYLTEQDEPGKTKSLLEEMVEDLQPGLIASAHHLAFLPIMTVTQDLPQSRLGGLTGRQTVELPQQPGIFLAGDWVGSEGLLSDAAAASARQAVDCVTRFCLTQSPERARMAAKP